MILKSVLQKFIVKFKTRLFYVKDGFFVLPYLANSPKIMLDSMSWMPFVKINEKKNVFQAKNPFFEGDCHYEELEEGLWILVSDVKFKKNVSYELIYDATLPIEYYTLSLYMNETRRVAPSSLINNMVNVDRGWMLHKPGDKAINGHFAGSRGLFFVIYFSQKWLDNNTNKNKIFSSDKMKEWLHSDSTSLFIPELFNATYNLSSPILKTILTKGEKGVNNKLKLKIQTLELMSTFIEKMQHKDVQPKSDIMTNPSRRKILKAEKRLSDAIFEGFPGIENLASDIGMSTTKLKNDFKETYGYSLFKYFQLKQMESAKEMLLQDPSLKISYVANILGYINPSKFSAAFKKNYGYLPSEVHQIDIINF
ncbi:helix-turn-helix domain-containing protein [Tenacibaculum agarivorans]|uniref:helix-turn-helix domain-containing protein n=1 Tax=Tenacibaculum agarivorans TaxID=1908389 RepID=UPI00094B7B57|nr:AraC family transcriptional regulator [Tenacibaculum agarivorans]